MTMDIPAGYKRNAMGHLVPVEQIKETDSLRDEFVLAATAVALDLSAQLAVFKRKLIGDMDAFLNLSAEQYGVQIGGAKGNITLTSFDGRFRITKEVAERIEFDERLQAAKVLVDECLREWSRFAGQEIKTIIEDAFQVDKKGRINTMRILALRKHKIEHPSWLQAMKAIDDAVTVTGSCTYYRFHERDEQGKYRQIILDFSGV